MTPTELAQAQLDAYNAQDLDKYVSYFAEDCIISDLNGAVAQTSRAEIRERYEKAFAAFPQNKAELKNRIVVGNSVVDHELVIRAPGGEQFEIIAIYSVRGDKIARVDFAK
jgi:uncharacterized protein (TIGR02246 family)